MADTQPENNADLSAQVQALEGEARKLLAALRWSSTVRNILLFLLVAFVVGFGVLFYQFYQDVSQNRIAAAQKMLEERQQEFIEPLTREVFDLAEEVGPEIMAVFRKQATEDSPKYLKAFDVERAKISASFEPYLETRLNEFHQEVLKKQEAALVNEFPELKDPEKMAKVHANLEKTLEKIGKRYYVDYSKTEFEKLITSLDNFPAAEPSVLGTPVAEQVVTEMLSLVQMMIANSENYVAAAESGVNGSTDGAEAATEDGGDEAGVDSAAEDKKVEDGDNSDEAKTDDDGDGDN